MVRASAHGDVRIMIPMVASVHELREVRKLLDAGHAGGRRARPRPRAKNPAGHDDRGARARRHGRRFRARGRVLQHRDQRSHSVLARDRPSEPLARAAGLALRSRHPAPDPAGRARGRCERDSRSRSAARWPVDPLAAVLLVGLGVRELSMEAAAIPEIKEAIRRVTLAECEKAAEAVLACDSAEAVEELVAANVRPAPLRPLGREHRGRLVWHPGRLRGSHARPDHPRPRIASPAGPARSIPG